MAPCWQEQKIQTPWSSILPSGPSDLGHNVSLTSPIVWNSFLTISKHTIHPASATTADPNVQCTHISTFLNLISLSVKCTVCHESFSEEPTSSFPHVTASFLPLNSHHLWLNTLQVPWNQWPQGSRTGYWRQRFPRELGKWLLQFPHCSNIQNLEE